MGASRVHLAARTRRRKSRRGIALTTLLPGIHYTPDRPDFELLKDPFFFPFTAAFQHFQIYRDRVFLRINESGRHRDR
jgi:hypothetical protein